MTTFRNSYHFVPRAAKRQPIELPNRQAEYGLGASITEGHAAYAPNTHSGRVCCRVTLECPTVIGAERVPAGPGEASTVLPFLFLKRPAIPATSLKGLVSAVAEAVSAAPYRVLPDARLTIATGGRNSTRAYAGDGHSGIGTTHAYFDPDLLPLTTYNKDPLGRVSRSEVNPVEVMFGFVRDKASVAGNARDREVSAAAGKLRFSHALPSGNWLNAPCETFFLNGEVRRQNVRLPSQLRFVLLKEQGQPMKRPKRMKQHQPDPPHYAILRSATPNFYFIERANPSAFIDKGSFGTSSPMKYAAQGGKFYLHHPDGATGEPWKTANPTNGAERKAAVAPLKAGVTFDFHIDFDNLSDRELGILCYALRPSERFRHKIGLGKALGLGSIRIDILDLVKIDRDIRYQSNSVFEEDPRQTPRPVRNKEEAVKARAAHDTWLEENDPKAKRALLALGETHDFDGDGGENARIPVCWVPLTEEKLSGLGRDDAEDRSFKWFVDNDQGPRQKLLPIGEKGIPTLEGTSRADPPKGPRRLGQPRTPSPADQSQLRRGTLTRFRTDRNGNTIASVRDDVTGEDYVVFSHLYSRHELRRSMEGAPVDFQLGEARSPTQNPPVSFLRLRGR